MVNIVIATDAGPDDLTALASIAASLSTGRVADTARPPDGRQEKPRQITNALAKSLERQQGGASAGPISPPAPAQPPSRAPVAQTRQ